MLAATQPSIDETLKLIIGNHMRGSAVFGVGTNMPYCLIMLIESGFRISGLGETFSNAAVRTRTV